MRRVRTSARGKRREARGIPPELPAVADDPANHGARARDLLGDRLHHDVGTKLEWARKRRRGERVVHDQGKAVFVTPCGGCGDVEHREARVRNRLGKDQANRVVELPLERLCRDLVHKANRDSHALEVGKELERPTVEGARRDDGVSRLAGPRNRKKGGSHARGAGQSRGTPLCDAHSLLEGGDRGVSNPRVAEAGLPPSKDVRKLLGCPRLEGSGLEDGNGNRAIAVVSRPPGMEESRREVHGWRAR